MNKILLFLITFFFLAAGVKAAAFHEAIVINNGMVGANAYNISLTAVSLSPALSAPNGCRRSRNPSYDCRISIQLERVYSNGSWMGMSEVLLVDRNPPNWCNSGDCNVTVADAETIGELVPLMKLRGSFGQTVTKAVYIPAQVIGLRTCVYVYRVETTTTSAYRYDCGDILPLISSCDIIDTDAIIDFGSFSNDVTNRQASGSFKVNCTGDANLRVKFAQSVTNMSLSQDGKLNASLKVRNSTPGNTETESFIKVSSGNQEIFIDGELKNNNTSHTGPFSTSVVAIVEIA
ncbi:hypothetical protein QRD25_01535 [Serratia marcescens]|uniref:hypothetical protein n=1 Tax=Serratia marcescens TaxID=615 RepID=UPI002570B9D3|nr:hypothetical protein [Serratia marcescens]WJD88302.1 hypothetical protein QRD25_01535 [Serratia marcescens]